MRHFIVKAKWSEESAVWIASWSGDDSFLVTEGKTEAKLEVSVKDAIETLLGVSDAKGEPYALTIQYCSFDRTRTRET